MLSRNSCYFFILFYFISEYSSQLDNDFADCCSDSTIEGEGVGIVAEFLNMETNSSWSSHIWFSTVMIASLFTESENGLGWNGPLKVT